MPALDLISPDDLLGPPQRQPMNRRRAALSVGATRSREVASVYVKANRTKAANIIRKRRQYRADRKESKMTIPNATWTGRKYSCKLLISPRNARLAELVDATDLKSVGP